MRQSVQLKINGMTCAACAAASERAVKKLPGVEEAAVNFSTEKLLVKFEDGALRVDDIKAAVAKAGYEAVDDRAEKEVTIPVGGMLPAVGFGAAHTFDPLPQVAVDNNAGGVIAVRELMKRGHRRIAFLNHEANNEIFVARSNGYLEAMKSKGCFRPEYLFELPGRTPGKPAEPELDPPDLVAVLDRMKALAEPPTAVIVANDWGAFGFLRACETRQVRVPNEFSVVGMDDSGKLCSLLTPPLASVAMKSCQTSSPFSSHQSKKSSSS